MRLRSLWFKALPPGGAVGSGRLNGKIPLPYFRCTLRAIRIICTDKLVLWGQSDSVARSELACGWHRISCATGPGGLPKAVAKQLLDRQCLRPLPLALPPLTPKLSIRLEKQFRRRKKQQRGQATLRELSAGEARVSPRPSGVRFATSAACSGLRLQESFSLSSRSFLRKTSTVRMRRGGVGRSTSISCCISR